MRTSFLSMIHRHAVASRQLFAMLSILMSGLIFSMADRAQAVTIYVATTGHAGAAGTLADPLNKVQDAINLAQAGDTVHVKPGNFQEHLSFPRSGTAAAPITVEGEAGATIDGSWNFTPTWTLVSGFDGVYSTPVPAETNCVTVDDQTITDLWWGYQSGLSSYGCRPNDVFPSVQHPYHYGRMFTYGFANVSGLPDCMIWAGTPEGWDAVRGLALWIPGSGGGTLWLKMKPGNAAPTVNVTTHNVKIAPADVPVVTINGASNLILRGLTIKNGYWGIDVRNSVGTVIEHCILKPVFNGIALWEGANGIVMRYNEISMNHYADCSTRSRTENVWTCSKLLLQYRSPYAADKVAIQMLNTVGNHRVHDNYIHDAGVGMESGWHGTPAEEVQFNTNIEADHNLFQNNYQDSFGIGKNCFNHKYHDNVSINVLQAFRLFGVYFGPMYIYRNIWIDGASSSQSIVHFSDSAALTPDVYIYNNTILDRVDTTYVASSFYANNIFDSSFGTGNPNFHYYNNFIYGDRFFKQINNGTDANWDGNYNVYAQRSTWKTDLGQAYATSRSIDLNTLWTTAAPGFTNLAANNVSLTSTSPARTKGTDLYTKFSARNGGPLPGGYGSGYYTGTAPDAGAVIYGAAMPVVPRAADTDALPPFISTLTPAVGVTTGGSSVSIMGSNFIGATGVSFGGTAATGVVVNQAGTQILCTSPAHASGNVNVTVTTPKGTSNNATFTYSSTFNATLNPTADSMVASGAPTTNYGTGNNMQTQTSGGASVWPIMKFDLTALQGTTVSSAVLRVYKLANGTSHVISASSGASDSWTETGVNWNNKPAKGSVLTTATVANSGWYQWDVTSFVNGQFSGDKVVTLYMTDEATTGVWSQWYSKESSFKPELVLTTTAGGAPPAPTLSGITPASGAAIGGTEVTLTGANLTGASVSFGGTAGTGVVVNAGGTQITVTSPAHAAGAVSVTATTGGGTSNGQTFTYANLSPTLTSVTPNTGVTGGGTSVTLIGTNLLGASGVSFGGSAATNIVVNGAGTQITATSPVHAAGAVSVTATTSYGTSNGVTFTYTGGGTPFNVTRNPTADSMVASNASGSNYGANNNMQTLMQWGNVFIWPIMKFDLTGITGSVVTSAKLRVYKAANTASHSISASSGASDSWTETGVTWNNKPAKGSVIVATTVANEGYYEWDVTSFVNAQFTGDKTVTLYLSDENNINIWSQWWSREGGTVKPELVLIGN